MNIQLNRTDRSVQNTNLKSNTDNSSEILDELNLNILSILQEDARKSSREIADRLDVATGTIYNRIKKMSDEGIIKGYIPFLDFQKIGFDLTALILIQVEGKHMTQVEEELAAIPNIVAVYDITGEHDAALIGRFKNRKSLNNFIKNMLKMEHIKRTVTSVVLNVVKEDFRINLLS
jgi:DNA-binding Lrp family transcriptional regulator